jgi:hypothetical protein
VQQHETYQQQSWRVQVAWVPKVEQAGVVMTGQLLVQALLLLLKGMEKLIKKGGFWRCSTYPGSRICCQDNHGQQHMTSNCMMHT